MSKEKETIVVILQGSVTKSLIRDLVTFLLYAGLMLFNHQYLAGSTLIDLLFIIMVTMWLVGLRSSNLYNGDLKGAKKFLDSKEG